MAIKDFVETRESLRTSVVVRECPDCICDYGCPSLSVSGPTDDITAGHLIDFFAVVSGESQDGVTYDWKVSNGRIIRGQGTPLIVVATTRKMAGSQLKATVTISDKTPAHICPNTASATAKIRSRAKKLK